MQKSENKTEKKVLTKFGENPTILFEIRLNGGYSFLPGHKISMEDMILSPQAYAKVIEKLEEIEKIIIYYTDNPERSGWEDVNEIIPQSFADAVEKGARVPL